MKCTHRLETISKDAKRNLSRPYKSQHSIQSWRSNNFFRIEFLICVLPAITLEDVTHSLDGVILNDYYQWLHTTASQLDSVISNAQDSLIAIRKKRAKEFQNAMNKEAEPYRLRVCRTIKSVCTRTLSGST